jgi:lon-related putative ATP-dependent protease
MSTNDNDPRKLSADALFNRCDPAVFAFATTDDLPDLDGAIGQQRALAALEFGVKMPGEGYNLYLLGKAGSHRRRIAEAYLADQAPREALADWCYVNNFDDERKPVALRLPAGKATAFKHDMAALVEELVVAIPAAFESEHYRNRLAEIGQEYEELHRAKMEALQEEAQRQGVSLVSTPHGFAIAPTDDGKLLSDDAFDKLPEKRKERTRAAMQAMTEKVREHIEELPEWNKQRLERVKALNREVAESAVSGVFEHLRERYSDLAALVGYLDQCRNDVLENARAFLPQESGPTMFGMSAGPPLRRYEVNVIVDQSTGGLAPIVYEGNPTYQNLLGRIEHVPQFGALVTDFTMIRPGAVHRANGGFLLLDAERLLSEPFAWSSLKRTLFDKAVRMESLGQQLSLVSTVTLEPDPIPVDLKVVVIGSRYLYYLLCELDPDFQELFKVAADFEDEIDRSDDNVQAYGQLVATLARREQLRPLTAAGVARVIEHGSRLIDDTEKLSTRLRDVSDLVRESDYYAGKAAQSVIDAAHVQAAIDAQLQRLGRLRETSHEEILRDSVLIDTTGAQVGQVNGLSVIDLGRIRFGQPSRITANVWLGDGKIVDIEHETELGGPIHSKGMLILSSYVSARFAPGVPVSFSASLVFEQSYGGVEGDSASVAETCALLSALADLPIKQSLAVTGSVNQHGQVQVIGGVNEKVEGFFDICRARGPLGDHGVLIPADNVKHLMLRADVVEAVRDGSFSIYAIATIEEAIELLTGVAAGARDATGGYPSDSVFGRVTQRLFDFARERKAFDHADKDDDRNQVIQVPVE